MKPLAAMLALTLAAPPPAWQPDWRNVALAWGLTAKFPNGGDTTKRFIIETTGSGIATLDYDGDGYPDVFVLSGKGGTNRLYRNERGQRLRDVTAETGITADAWHQGVCSGDIDGDGRPELLFTRWGGLQLLHNDAGRRFTDITKSSGLEQSGPARYNTGCAFLDYDHDGDLDLIVANYLEFDFATTPPPGANPYCYYRGIAVNCGPRGLPFSRNLLYRNDNGHFTDVSVASKIATPQGHYALGVLTGDFDGDGWVDIYISCDQTPSLLYINQKDGTFSEEAVLRGAAFDENGRAMSGMGADAADYDGDGWLDIFRTNFSDERETLYRNQGQGLFDEVTARLGLAKNTRFVGWGCAFFDFDLDGFQDLLLVNGHVFPEVDRLGLNVHYRERAILYRNDRGQAFVDVSESAGPAVLEPHSARGLAIADLDNDGSPEVVINNQNQAPSLWKLATRSPQNWLLLALDGPGRNRSSIGAIVRLTAGGRTQSREVRSGGGYLSQSDLRPHFGLGTAKTIDRLEVLWPTGERALRQNIPANQILHLSPDKP